MKNRNSRNSTWTEKNEKGRWRAYDYEELIKRDKINLDILIPSLPFAQSASRPSRLIRRTSAAQLWLKDEALEESANLPAPEVIAADIVADLEAALEQFATIADDLKKGSGMGVSL